MCSPASAPDITSEWSSRWMEQRWWSRRGPRRSWKARHCPCSAGSPKGTTCLTIGWWTGSASPSLLRTTTGTRSSLSTGLCPRTAEPTAVSPPTSSTPPRPTSPRANPGISWSKIILPPPVDLRTPPSPSSPLSELVSEPELSFTMMREGTYFALVKCESLKGTPPITFSLYNGTELVDNETVDVRQFSFPITVDLERHMGWLQCQAENGDRVVHSKWVPMHVVPVGGAVWMHFDTSVGENFSIVGLRFYCSVERGTSPRYRWFLNGTALEDRGDFYWVEPQPKQSILLLSVGRESSGTYHCEVSNSFDNQTGIRSEKKYIDKEVLNQLPLTVKAVVFGCFLFLVSLVTTCCFIGCFYRNNQCHVEKSMLDLRLGLEMHKIMAADNNDHDAILLGHPCFMVAEYDNKVDEKEYMEGEELVRADKDTYSDQGESDSIDEWPEIQQELKKTLEDEDDLLDEP
ncbi:uncharacterized protein si:dkey-93h22.7 isoform X4 [Esox lucius]|uniref:uncharacterized protein si:dkey-93h22.7 isoform X4 n=1 Tax=Esox lucius TaxID=8010 RepID=UPI0014770EFB|nr:uncharacterized protein si:dkey-93h22.7 isoform X4 [Esox lucius]